MSFEVPQDPENEQRRREMLTTVEEALMQENYGIAQNTLETQTYLRPHEVAQYLDVKRRGTENKDYEARWHCGLDKYLSSLVLDQGEYTDDERQAIQEVKDRLIFDEITSIDFTAPEPEMEPRKQRKGKRVGKRVLKNQTEQSEQSTQDPNVDYDPENWDDDEFYIQFSEDDVERIRGTRVFKVVEEYATSRNKVPAGTEISCAIEIIDEYASDEAASEMRKMLDWFVFQRAIEYATSRNKVPAGTEISYAAETINNYASDPDAAKYMRVCLDKYVYKHAEEYADGQRHVPAGTEISYAKETIDGYASTEERKKAMLRQLGL